MKLAEFHERRDECRRGGFRVSFERPVRGGWLSDTIPETDEAPLPTEEEAWFFATEVAMILSEAVNIHVIDGRRFTPVEGYLERIIRGHYGNDR